MGLIEGFEEKGIGLAIMNRIVKATSGRGALVQLSEGREEISRHFKKVILGSKNNGVRIHLTCHFRTSYE